MTTIRTDTLFDNDKTINATQIIYNDNFKEFISRMKRKYEYNLQRVDNYETLLIYQDEIRNEIYNHNFDLRDGSKINGHYTYCPDRYAIFMAIISDLSQCSSFEDIIKTNRYEKEDVRLGVDDDGDVILDDSKCACNHAVTSGCFWALKNEKTEMVICLGYDCIEKDSIIEKEKLKKLKKERVRQLKEIKAKKTKKENVIQKWKNLVLKATACNKYALMRSLLMGSRDKKHTSVFYNMLKTFVDKNKDILPQTCVLPKVQGFQRLY